MRKAHRHVAEMISTTDLGTDVVTDAAGDMVRPSVRGLKYSRKGRHHG